MTTTPQQTDGVQLAVYGPTEYTAAQATLTVLLPSGRCVSMDAIGPRLMFGSLSEPEVNWPSIGSCSPEDGRAFALALLRACEEAEDLSGPACEVPALTAP